MAEPPGGTSGITSRLAEWVASTTYQALPSDVVAAVKVYVLDNLAAGFAGARTSWADMAASLHQEASVGSCSLFARPWTTSASAAALVNGVAIGGFECDHPFSQGNCHPSVAVFPALLAIAEQEHLDGRTFLTAMAAGYEALCRIGVGATRAVEDERGFHGPGTNAAFGGAAAVGRALGFSADQVGHALGIAGSHGGGLLEFFREGAMTKRMHLGRGSQMGLESALLAARGFTGPSTVLEGEHGFFHAYSPAPRPELVLKDIGERYLLREITIKAYPCHVSFQAVVDAIRRSRDDHTHEPVAIQGVRIEGSGRFFEERFGERAPTTMMGAQYSLPWSVAMALSRDVADPSAWTEHNLVDTQLLRLASMLELVERDVAGEPPATVTITSDGSTHTIPITDWKGAPTNPCSFEDASEKLARYAAPYLSAEQIDQISERIASFERLSDAMMLASAIRGDRPSN